MRREHRLRDLLVLGVVGLAVGLGVVGYGFGFLNTLERQTIDKRFSVRGKRSTLENFVFVKIDDVTIDELRILFPFPRSIYAAALDRIRAGQPRLIAVDIQFTEPTEIPEDNALVGAVERNRGKIVLAATEVDERGRSNVLGGPEFLREIGARDGDALLPLGAKRRFFYAPQGLKNFAVAGAEIVLGRPITRSEMGGDSAWIDYAGPPETIPSVSLSSLLRVRVEKRGAGRKPWKVLLDRGRRPDRVIDEAAIRERAEEIARAHSVPASRFRDKIVVIGATAPSLQDLHDTSTGPEMAGAEIQANAVSTAMRGFPLRSASTLANVFLIVALGLIVPFVSLRGSPLITVATAVLFGGLFLVGTQMAFDRGRIVSFVYPLGSLVLASVGSLGVHYLIAAFERERVRDVFSRFVPEQVVDEVLKQAGGDLRLGGKEIVSTVMFSDLRGFTSSAEEMPASQVIRVLNHYLHEMSEAILAHGGTLICYMGDGIYAIFGAPLEQEDHADRALAASREMLLERLPGFNAWMKEQGLGEGYFMGIGLNSGPVMTGNVGHERRMDYTAVGDVTNTASRIEGMTKGTPYSVLVAESTIEMMKKPPPDIVYYDELDVRGRLAKLKLWALDIRKPDDAPDLVAARKAKEAKEAAAAAAPVKTA